MSDDIAQRLEKEVQDIVAVVEELTGLKSRWSGEVLLADRSDQMFERRPFLAKKEWSCHLKIADFVAQQDWRWRTLIHEALHSISVGIRYQDYETLTGWEEGVVEWLQRCYRPEILRRLNIHVPEAVLQPLSRIGIIRTQ